MELSQQDILSIFNKINKNDNPSKYDKYFNKITIILSDINNTLNIKIYELDDMRIVYDFFTIFFKINNPITVVSLADIYFQIIKCKKFWKMCYSFTNIYILTDIFNNLIYLSNKLQNLLLTSNLLFEMETLVKELNSKEDANDEFNEIILYLYSKNYTNILTDEYYRQELEHQFNNNLSCLENNMLLNNCLASLSSCTDAYLQYYLFCSLFPFYFKKYIKKAKDKKTDFITIALCECINILNKFILKTDYIISLEEEDNFEKLFVCLKKEKQIMKQFPDLIYPLSIIINEIVIIPERIELNIKAFIILKRFFFLFKTHRIKISHILSKIILNIGLFSTKCKQLKEVSYFLKIIQNNGKYYNNNFDILFDKSENNEYNAIVNKILSNKYYNKKFIFNNKEDNIITSISHMNKVITKVPLKATINSGNFKIFSFFSKDNAKKILLWKFKIEAYDINVGIYKIESFSNCNNIDEITQYNKCILEFENYKSGNNYYVSNTLITDPGLYYVIFDNTFSIFKDKSINYEFFLLE